MKPLILAVAASIAMLAGPVQAGTYSGTWAGGGQASLEFLKKHQVRYCYFTQCSVLPYSGNSKRVFLFRWGASVFEFTHTNTGYHGILSGQGVDPDKIDMRPDP